MVYKSIYSKSSSSKPTSSGYKPIGFKPAAPKSPIKTQRWNNMDIPADIPTKNLAGYDPVKDIRYFKIGGQDNLGVYGMDKNKKIAVTPRDYAGIQAEKGKHRDHIVPVSLGGSSLHTGNIKSISEKQNRKFASKIETPLSAKVKSGELSDKQGMNEALRQKSDAVNPDLSVTKNFFKGLAKTAAKVLTPGYWAYKAGKKVEKAIEPITKPILDKTFGTKTGQKIVDQVGSKTGNVGIKIVSAVEAVGTKKTYKQAYDAWQKKATNPNNNEFEKVLAGVQSSLPQSALGVALSFIPYAGKPLSMAYWTALSADEQIKTKGSVTSVGNIAIDVAGDRMLGSALQSIFKSSSKALLPILAKTFGIEGSTEVAQDILKMGNDYRNAQTPAEQIAILDRAKNYFKNGDILRTAAIGGLSGAGIGAAGYAADGAISQSQNQVNVPQVAQDPTAFGAPRTKLVEPTKPTPLPTKYVPLSTAKTASDKAIGGKSRESFINPLDGKVQDSMKIPSDWASYTSIQKQKYLDALEQYDPKNYAETVRGERTEVATTSPLTQEARKYKSAEEFVRGREPLFHGTDLQSANNINSGKIIPAASRVSKTGEELNSNAKYGGGFSLSRDANIAKGYGDSIVELYIDPQAKIATVADAPSFIFRQFPDGQILFNQADAIKWAKSNGFDGIDLHSFEMKTTSPGKSKEIQLFNPAAIKTKSQLTDIYNKATQATPPAVVEETKPQKPPESPKPSEPKTFKSRVFERMQAEHPQLEGELNYDPITMREQAERAVELIATDKQKAYDIAMGREVSSELTLAWANIAMSEKALDEGNNELFERLIRKRSLSQTRNAQELVSERGSITDNSTSKYVKELLASRLDALGKRYLSDVRNKVTKTTDRSKAMKIIDNEVAKVEAKIKSKKLEVKDALSLLDKLTCLD